MNLVNAELLAKKVKERFPHCITTCELMPGCDDPHYYIVVRTKDNPDESAPLTLATDLVDWIDTLLRILVVKEPPALALLDWQISAIADLIFNLPEDGKGSTKVAQVEDNALYLRPETWGQRRWHMIIGDWNDGLTLEQSDLGEKYHQRVTLEVNEIIPFVRWLLQWYLKGLAPEPKPPVEQLPAAGQDEVEKINDEFGPI